MKPDKKIVEVLANKARKVRRLIIQMLCEAGSGHTGGCLSAVDIVTTLYFHHMQHNPKDPDWPERDRFILSKGHCAPLLYAVLAECGYFPEEELKTLRKIGSRLQGHPDMKKLPGIEATTGSLGQGLSISNGIALGGKLNKLNYAVYVLLGDGETGEGQVWEAAMFANHYRLDNVVAILDRNRLQVDGPTEDIMAIEPVKDKWLSFGWHTIEVNGHNFPEILDALEESGKIDKPVIIIADTIKGRGVSFMEDKVGWHGKAPNREEAEKALEELNK
jgi:transketolase